MNEIRVVDHVRRALDECSPVVALESTVVAHGLPHPLNLETALSCEKAVREHGATPATIGIVDGVPTVGLDEDQIRQFASGKDPRQQPIEKVGLNNLASVMVRGGWGATTVASSLKLAHAVGIRVFSTGGIGGVHRGAAESFDISTDLTALGSTPMVCVCAGAKAILDLPKTRERLETLGIPVIGYGTDEFPAFYSRDSGLDVDVKVKSADEVADLSRVHWQTGSNTALLVCVPVPEEYELSADEIATATEMAMANAASKRVRGKALTPLLLAELEKLTRGKSLEANRALLVNNARVAASIATSFR